MGKKSAANSGGTAKPRGKPWPKGVSGNPAGAPKRGESWAEIIREVGDQTGAEAAEAALLMAKDFLKLGNGVTLKRAAVYAVFRSVINEPQPGLLNALMERAEGKVKDQLELSGDSAAPLRIVIEYDQGPSAGPASGPAADQAGA